MNLDALIDEKLTAEEERLRKVIADAQKTLNGIEEFRRLKSHLKPVLSGDIQDAGGLAHLGAVAESVEFSLARKTGRAATLKDQILDACEEILTDGRRRFSRELLRELAYKGVMLTGRDPATNLASYLSREKARFQSDKKAGGWALVRLIKQTRPGSAPTLPGLHTNGAAERRPGAG
jgi:hypothetical protein